MKENLTLEQDVIDIAGLATKICGIERGSLSKSSRAAKYSLPRTVVSNIARIDKGIHFDIIAKVLNRDRCSIYHYQKIHKDNYRNWTEYRELFNRVYQAFTDLRDSRKKFVDVQDLRSHIIRAGVVFSDNPSVFIDINSDMFTTSINTDYKNLSSNMEIIRIAMQGYEISSIDINYQNK